MQMIRYIGVLIIAMSISGCFLMEQPGSIDLDKPTPLARIQERVHPRVAWRKSIGDMPENLALKMSPQLSGNRLVYANNQGDVVSMNVVTGAPVWHYRAKTTISAHPTISNGRVYVTTENGSIIAIKANTGGPKWKNHVSNEILAPAAEAHGIVLVKSIDGTVTAFDAYSGSKLWHYTDPTPSLILRASSSPVIAQGKVLIGGANGKLTALSLRTGKLIWQSTIAIPNGAFTVKKLVDIDADPVVQDGRIYVVSYQGNLAALSLRTGEVLWQHTLSSYTGLAVTSKHTYVSDDEGIVWAFDNDTGTVLWRQDKLKYRHLTGPALQGHYLVVADALGFIHWLSLYSGEIYGRIHTRKDAPIIATPTVNDNHLYVVTMDGYLISVAVS